MTKLSKFTLEECANGDRLNNRASTDVVNRVLTLILDYSPIESNAGFSYTPEDTRLLKVNCSIVYAKFGKNGYRGIVDEALQVLHGTKGGISLLCHVLSVIAVTTGDSRCPLISHYAADYVRRH
ncbi:hypothetical protein EOM33_05660 [Candidatus Saccharibacteria bacterium]|nr:hypothetical protein [Candidatus Saccharibacteria bacterium]